MADGDVLNAKYNNQRPWRAESSDWGVTSFAEWLLESQLPDPQPLGMDEK